MATKLDLNIQEVIQKYQETKSIEKVSEHFGVSCYTISKLLKSNNVEIIGNTKRLNDQEVIQKYQETKSIEKVSEHFAVSRRTISNLLKSNKIDIIGNSKLLNEQEIIEKYYQYKSSYSVANELRVSSSTVRRILHKHGIPLIKTSDKTHGKSYSTTYRCWLNIKRCCYNCNSNGFKYYGGRGIKVCERWHNFQNFLEDMGECPNGYRLERLDASKDYFKENCKWELKTKSFLNRRDTLTLEIDGVTKPLLVWYDEKQINYTYANFVNIFHKNKQRLIHLIKNADNRHS